MQRGADAAVSGPLMPPHLLSLASLYCAVALICLDHETSGAAAFIRRRLAAPLLSACQGRLALA